jgi:DNA-binding LacI/PurR family transcriptional regulator
VAKSSRTPAVIRSTAEFARYVGLSRSAVSRVLNDQPGLREETIVRVREAMAETGFTPNAHARHLRGKPTAVIGVCMENFLTPTAVSKLSVLQGLLAAEGYSTLAEMSRPGAYDRVVRHFLSLRVDGIVFIGHFDAPELTLRVADLRRHGTAYVVVDNPGVEKVNTVTLDRVAAMREVVAHLVGLKHRRFGLLGLFGRFQTVTDRLLGVREELAARGLDPDRCVVSHDDRFKRGDHFEYGRTLAQSFMAVPDRPTAFIAVNDDTAVGALLEFQERGLRVPHDLSMVGFNNQNVCLVTRPRLTSVDQQIPATMAAAVRGVLQQIGRATPMRPFVQTIPPRLVLRDSIGPAPRKS